MSWFNFFSRKKEYYVSLSGVSKEFGLSQTYILNLLSNAGYNSLWLQFAKLNNEHLEVILAAYTNAVKSYYKESSKNFSKFDRNKQEELRKYFRQFVHKSFFNADFTIIVNDKIQLKNNGRIFSKNLDVELIREYFFERISKLELKERILDSAYEIVDELQFDFKRSSQAFIHRELKWRVRIKHTFNDIKSRIFTIILTGHYYIFTAEEDLSTAFLTSFRRCFSAVNETLGEVFEFNNSKFNPLWIKIYPPLLKG